MGCDQGLGGGARVGERDQDAGRRLTTGPWSQISDPPGLVPVATAANHHRCVGVLLPVLEMYSVLERPRRGSLVA